MSTSEGLLHRGTGHTASHPLLCRPNGRPAAAHLRTTACRFVCVAGTACTTTETAPGCCAGPPPASSGACAPGAQHPLAVAAVPRPPPCPARAPLARRKRLATVPVLQKCVAPGCLEVLRGRAYRPGDPPHAALEAALAGAAEGRHPLLVLFPGAGGDMGAGQRMPPSVRPGLGAAGLQGRRHRARNQRQACCPVLGHKEGAARGHGARLMCAAAACALGCVLARWRAPHGCALGLRARPGASSASLQVPGMCERSVQSCAPLLRLPQRQQRQPPPLHPSSRAGRRRQ